MATGTRTFGLDETLIEPRVLAPPPTRHALLVLLLVLAAILHFGTAGWSDIHDGPEGYYAAAARDMFRANSWLPQRDAGASAQTPPLTFWVTLASYKMFGVTATAARMPVALAMMASVALTFLIGERLGGYWRGFVAGLIQLCWLGSFIWGRMATAEPIFGTFIAGAMFCAVCGFQRAQTRRLWFGGVWICVALACLTKGAFGILYPAAVFLALSALFREARLRFRLLLDWRCLGVFLFVVLPIYFWSPWDWLPPFGDDIAPGGEGLALSAFLLRLAAWWFPAVLLILPALVFAARKIFRPHEFEFADALPLCWAAVGFLPLVFFPGRQDYHSMSMWSALALWIACAWDRAPRTVRLTGIGLSSVVGIVLATTAFRELKLPLWVPNSSIPMLVTTAIVLACLVAAYFAWKHREDLAITTMMLAMVPIGLSVAEAVARSGSHYSLANAARFLQPRLGDTGEVVFEGSSADASSLRFYLDRAPLIINARGDDSAEVAMQKMAAPHPVYLITRRHRIPFWQEQLTERFHIYHQATTCGDHVVINNQP